MKEITIDKTNTMNLEVETFKKEETRASSKLKEDDIARKKELQIAKEKAKKDKKIRNFKLFGKAVALSLFCTFSIKGYSAVNDKIVEYKENKAMEDYSKDITKVILNNRYFLANDKMVDANKYAYHYDKIAKYIDKEEELLDNITYQNKTVEVKDFYIASAYKYFKNNYGDVNQIVKSMDSTPKANLDQYVTTLGYDNVEDYVDSIYKINYELKKDNVSFQKAKK